jgi:6-phosphogluconate dehydrogenase
VRIAFIGLGKMGNRMVMKLLVEGHEVVVWNRTREKISNFQLQISNEEWKDRFSTADSIEDLIKKAKGQEAGPRIIWSMLPAGKPTHDILLEISKYVKSGDIVIDGGNSKFTDTEKRHKEFLKKGIEFLGVGVSGGVIAATEGYPLMVGGSLTAYEYIEPILDSLAKPGGGHEYFGEGGAGHFVKMVHNGIEYGYMQAIGEGFGVLEKSPYKLDLVKVASLYTKGTLLSGFMMDRTVEALTDDPDLSTIEGYIDDSGEGKWTIEQAEEENVEIENIRQSLEFRKKSRESKRVANSFAARMVAALRNAFGGHEVKKVTKDERLRTKDLEG